MDQTDNTDKTPFCQFCQFHTGPYFLNQAQSQHFLNCMTNPKPLSASLLAGIRKMRELIGK